MSPSPLITVGSSPITVNGTIDDPDARVVINSVEVTHAHGLFQADVTVEEGLNTVVIRGIDQNNNEGIATITVSLDKTPPYDTVDAPKDGATVFTDKVAVSGLVNDIVRGAVTEADAIVVAHKTTVITIPKLLIIQNGKIKA